MRLDKLQLLELEEMTMLTGVESVVSIPPSTHFSHRMLEGEGRVGF